MSFLLDADTCSAYLKGDRRVFNRFCNTPGACIGQPRLWVSFIPGCCARRLRPERLQALEQMLVDVLILDNGLPPPDMDLLNAATALVHDLTLVTHNVQDYANIPGLRIADWIAE